MTRKGIAVELEVRTNNGRRIDLLTNRYAIECKPITRDALLRAAAQMKLYASSFPNHEYVLAGMSPRSREGYKSAHSTAVDIRKEFGYTIWFIDRMTFFTEPTKRKLETKREIVPVDMSGKPMCERWGDRYECRDGLGNNEWFFKGSAGIYPLPFSCCHTPSPSYLA